MQVYALIAHVETSIMYHWDGQSFVQMIGPGHATQPAEQVAAQPSQTGIFNRMMSGLSRRTQTGSSIAVVPAPDPQKTTDFQVRQPQPIDYTYIHESQTFFEVSK